MKPRLNNHRRPQYNIKENVTLKNALNSGDIKGDIINEEEIEGRQFYVVRSNNRVFKVAKDAYYLRK